MCLHSMQSWSLHSFEIIFLNTLAEFDGKQSSIDDLISHKYDLIHPLMGKSIAVMMGDLKLCLFFSLLMPSP